MAVNVSGSVYKPFWADLPLADIHTATTPDVLHQLYQGVLKHLISWCQDLFSKEELDHHVRSLPHSFGVRHFNNGFSALSQISGTERKHMGRILLGCLVGAISKDGIKACKALLDFIYLAQYSTHDDLTLGYMEQALNEWNSSKSFFIAVGIRDDLNIPKFHSLQHYISSIRLLGTTDNYNTEMFERLHIDFAKCG
jgi:Plavaka transposase